MGKSENAVYNFIRLVNNGKVMVSNIKLNSKTVMIINNKQHKDTFSSDIFIETDYKVNALVVTIMDDKIKKHTNCAMFQTNYYDFELNGNSLEITNGNNMIIIS